MSGSPGLRIMFCSVTRWLKLALRERDDRKILRCSVQAGVHQANWTDLLINVYYAPIIQCEPATARLGDINVTLECSVRARPDLGTLYWVIDSNGTTMTSNEKNNDYTILVRVRDDNVLVIQLILAYVRHNSFRKYHIEARNAIGSTNNSVLLERHPSYGSHPHPNDPHKSPMVQPSSSRLLNNRHNDRPPKGRISSSTHGKRASEIFIIGMHLIVSSCNAAHL